VGWIQRLIFLLSHHCHINAEITAGQQMSRLAEMQHHTTLHKHLYEIISIQVDCILPNLCGWSGLVCCSVFTIFIQLQLLWWLCILKIMSNQYHYNKITIINTTSIFTAKHIILLITVTVFYKWNKIQTLQYSAKNNEHSSCNHAVYILCILVTMFKPSLKNRGKFSKTPI
jgi:hypothetical protein